MIVKIAIRDISMSPPFQIERRSLAHSKTRSKEMKKPTLGWQLFAVWLNANCNCFLLDPITFDLAGTSLYTISEPSVIEAACFVNQMTGCKISTKFAFALGTSFSTPKDDIA